MVGQRQWGRTAARHAVSRPSAGNRIGSHYNGSCEGERMGCEFRECCGRTCSAVRSRLKEVN